jgi:CRISPR-associated endonuclease/helicase Cas3
MAITCRNGSMREAIMASGLGIDDFGAFFRAATGHEPYGYQARIARAGFPEVVAVPTGTGKTGVILAWLWRRLAEQHRDGTPRRLIYALPQRSLADQVAAQARGWLEALGLADEVALHVALGGRGESRGDWRENPHRPAIVIGPADSLVSKALNRGYGISRAIYPIDFALVTNGAQWVIDEIALCRESATTLRQLAAFASRFGTAEPFGLTCMSATVPGGLLLTADNPSIRETVQIQDEERTGPLATRLAAARTVRHLATGAGDHQAMAAAVAQRHRPGTLTLVVMNTVDAAQAVYRHLRGGPAETTLLHARFRGIERGQLMAGVTGRPDDRIMIATQVIEAGTDLNAALLVTEAAPWPSLVQRAGRCNRTGTLADAELWWTSPAKPAPYDQQDIDAASAQLGLLEGRAVTGEDLLACEADGLARRVAVVRGTDLLWLFDTAPDLSGGDVDIAPYVRDPEERDAEVAWAIWTPDANGAPDPEVRVPAAEYRCRVPLGDVARLAKDRGVWRFDQAARTWVTITAPGQARARPGEVLLVSAADGGYSPQTGFDLSARGPVAGCPELLTPAELAAVSAGAADASAAGSAADPAGGQQRQWISVDQHSRETRDQAQALLDVLSPGLPSGVAESTVIAAWLHDAGKAHRIWQDALCALAAPEDRVRIESGRPWAKSGGEGGALEFEGGARFRHELASLLLLDGPLRDPLAGAPDPELAKYLVLAHHGKLRVQVRDPGDLTDRPEGEAAEMTILGLRHGAVSDIPPMLGRAATTLTVDLGQFEPGGDRSWTRTVLGLRDRYGPFLLAYLEALVRVADWRASGGRELAAGEARESRSPAIVIRAAGP